MFVKTNTRASSRTYMNEGDETYFEKYKSDPFYTGVLYSSTAMLQINVNRSGFRYFNDTGMPQNSLVIGIFMSSI